MTDQHPERSDCHHSGTRCRRRCHRLGPLPDGVVPVIGRTEAEDGRIVGEASVDLDAWTRYRHRRFSVTGVPQANLASGG